MHWNNDNNDKWFLSRCFSCMISLDVLWKYFWDKCYISENQGSVKFATKSKAIYLVSDRSKIWPKSSDYRLDIFSIQFSQFSSVAQSCLTLCNPMNRSTPGLPVHRQLPESTHTHVHRVGDTIQPSHPLSSPFPPAPNPSQHQDLFQWVNPHMRWPKYWSFSFSISPSNEYL